MPIRQTTAPPTDEEIRQRMKQANILKLKYVGESCVRHARELPNPPASFIVTSKSGEKTALPGHQPNYFDWTSNLRSSVGFVIVDDGTIVLSNFENKGGAEGVQRGKEAASTLAARYPQGLVLIVVAGMSYADYVQRRGYDVIASSELIAEQLIGKFKLKATIQHAQ